MLTIHVFDGPALHGPRAGFRVEYVLEGCQPILQEAGHSERLEGGAGLVRRVDRRQDVGGLPLNGHHSENISGARIRHDEFSTSGPGLLDGLRQHPPPNLLHVHIEGQNDLATLPRSLHDNALPRDRLTGRARRQDGLAHDSLEDVVVRLLDPAGGLASPHRPEETPGQATLGVEAAVLTLEVNAGNILKYFAHGGRMGLWEKSPRFRRRRSRTYDLFVQPECLDQQTCHGLHVSKLPRSHAHVEGLATDSQLDTRSVEHRSPNRSNLHTRVVLVLRLLSPERTLNHLHLGGSGHDQASAQQPAREKHPPTYLHPGINRALSASHWAVPGSHTISEASSDASGWCIPRCS